MDVLSGAKSVAVVIDLENVSAPGEGLPGKVLWMLDGIRDVCRKKHIYQESLWAATTFCYGWRKNRMSLYRGSLDYLFRKHRGSIQWGDELADTRIIRYIEDRLDAGDLPEAVILVTGDGDFIPIVEKLRGAGKRLLLVYPGNGSRKLTETADQALSLSEFVRMAQPANLESSS